MLKKEQIPTLNALIELGLIKLSGDSEKIEAFSRHIFEGLYKRPIERTCFAIGQLCSLDTETNTELEAKRTPFYIVKKGSDVDQTLKMATNSPTFLSPRERNESSTRETAIFDGLKSVLLEQLERIAKISGNVPEWIYEPLAQNKYGVWLANSEFVSQLTKGLSKDVFRAFYKGYYSEVEHPLYELSIDNQICLTAVIQTKAGYVRETVFESGAVIGMCFEQLTDFFNESVSFYICECCYKLISQNDAELIDDRLVCKNKNCSENIKQNFDHISSFSSRDMVFDKDWKIAKNKKGIDFCVDEHEWISSYETEVVHTPIFSVSGELSEAECSSIIDYLAKNYEFTSPCPSCWCETESWHWFEEFSFCQACAQSHLGIVY